MRARNIVRSFRAGSCGFSVPRGPTRRLCTQGTGKSNKWGRVLPASIVVAAGATAVALLYKPAHEWLWSFFKTEEAARPLPHMSEGDDTMTRQQLKSQFKFQRRLGTGGFGEVWQAVDSKSGRVVAIKLLSLESGLTPAQVESEIKSLRTVGSHPHVAELLQVTWIKAAMGERLLPYF